MATATLARPQAQQLEYATITVQYVNEKKPGARNASIKDVDGAYYWVKPEELANFQAGGIYEISFITTESNGYTNRTIKSYEPQQRPTPAPQRQAQPQQRAQAQQGPRPTVVRSAPVEQPQPERPAPAPATNGNGQCYRPTHPRDGRRMFITATLGHFIETGRVDCNAQSIADAIAEIIGAYDATIGAETE